MGTGYVFISINERSKEMRFSPIFLILLTVTACATQQALSQVSQMPTPVAVISDTPVSSVTVFSTPIPVCACPTGIFNPTQSQGGAISRPPVICNCPAIILPPTISATEVGSNLDAMPTNGITLEDNGKTFFLHPGESFLLNLGIDVFDWTVDIDNQNVLSRVKNVMVIRGAQGIYEANSPGQAVLTAIGNPFCRKSVPPCMAPSIQFKITVIVK
jgi:hypothetical protein